MCERKGIVGGFDVKGLEYTSAPAILFSPASMGLSDWTVGPSLNSPPRGMLVGWFVVLINSGSRLLG